MSDPKRSKVHPDFGQATAADNAAEREAEAEVLAIERRGAQKFVADVHAEARRIAGKRNAEYRDFGAALLTVEYDLVRGEWPKEER